MELAKNQKENEATTQSKLYFIKTDGLLMLGEDGFYTFYVNSISFAEAVEKVNKLVEEKEVYLPKSWCIRSVEFIADVNFDSQVGNILVS